MSNPFRGPDPLPEPYVGKQPLSAQIEELTGVRHPKRFEPGTVGTQGPPFLALGTNVTIMFRSGQVATSGAGLQTLASFPVPGGTLLPSISTLTANNTLRVTCVGHAGADGGTVKILYGGNTVTNQAIGGNTIFYFMTHIILLAHNSQGCNIINVVTGVNPLGAYNTFAVDETQPATLAFQAVTAVATPVSIDQILVELIGSK